MIGGESSFSDGKAGSTTVPSMRKVRFLEYISGVLSAFLHPAPMRATDESPGAAPEAVVKPDLPGGNPAPVEISRPGRRAARGREPALTNRVRAPRVYRTGSARRNGFAIIGGSLDARLSHRPAGHGGDSGGMRH